MEIVARLMWFIFGGAMTFVVTMVVTRLFNYHSKRFVETMLWIHSEDRTFQDFFDKLEDLWQQSKLLWLAGVNRVIFLTDSPYDFFRLWQKHGKKIYDVVSSGLLFVLFDQWHIAAATAMGEIHGRENLIQLISAMHDKDPELEEAIRRAFQWSSGYDEKLEVAKLCPRKFPILQQRSITAAAHSTTDPLGVKPLLELDQSEASLQATWHRFAELAEKEDLLRLVVAPNGAKAGSAGYKLALQKLERKDALVTA